MKMVGVGKDLKSEVSIQSKLDRRGDPSKVYDALRFTATAPPAAYTEKTTAFMQELHANGYTIDRPNSDNHWATPTYHGVNAIVQAPDGYRFEVQFHTPESFATKEANWPDYEKARSLPQDAPEAVQLRDKMAAAWARNTPPPGATDLLR